MEAKDSAMIVVNEQLLASFRTPGRCEWCGRACRVREPAHVLAKGMGGGGRLDVRWNLVALGSTLAWECSCHRDHHDGHRPMACDLFAIIARREQVDQDLIRAQLDWLRRVPKECEPCPCCGATGYVHGPRGVGRACAGCGGSGALRQDGSAYPEAA